ncbi:MAG TPA: hypothetical protein VGE04_12960 [Chloroflexia bacterium]
MLVFAALITAGCGGTSGPVTHVISQGVQADLPGEGWNNTGLSENKGFKSETWRNPDGTMVYRVSTLADDEFSTRLSSALVKRYMDAMYPWAAEATPAMLRGRNAYRMLAVHPDADEFTMIEYAVIYKGRHYFVGAGTTTSRWNNGGQDAVEGIIDTIKLEEPATPE